MKKKNRRTGVKRFTKICMLSPGWMSVTILLSVLAAVVYFIPYMSIYGILKEVLTVYPQMELLDINYIVRYGYVAAVGLVLYVVFYFGSLSTSHVASIRIAYMLRVQFSEALAKMPLGKVLGFGSGRLKKTMYGSVGEIQSYIAHQVPDIIMATVMTALLSGLLVLADWRYGIACLAGLGTAYYFCNRSNSYGDGGAKNMMDVYLDALEELNNEALEYVRGIQVVRSFNGVGKTSEKLQHAIREYTRLVIPYTLVWEKYRCVFEGIIHNLYLFLIPVGMFLLRSGGEYRAEATDFIFYLIMTPAVAAMAPKLSGAANQLFKCEGALERVDRIILTEHMKEPEKEAIVRDASVEFSHVSFRYEKEKQALSDVSFRVEPGRIMAIVGESGSGKTTIVSLLSGLWDADKGKIFIGGVEIHDISQDTLMENISFVFQDTYLFTDTVLENIKCGRPEASFEEVIDAAKAARCHIFISQLPQGYDTVIGSGGHKLSGGEQQRIAITRAILKNAQILVLDEATASADPENEYEIQQALSAAMCQKTVLMIAHRMTAVSYADQIIVMKKGKLKEQGTHEELMKEKGCYYRMQKTYEQAVNWKIRHEEKVDEKA